jgi:hypothetical protein
MLVPTEYTQDRLDQLPDQDLNSFTTGAKAIIIECGWHDGPDGKILIEKITQAVTRYGTVLYREDELWEYEVAGAPPIGYTRNVYGKAQLPERNWGRAYMLLETERADFIPWSWFQPGSANLSSVRKISCWCVYELSYDHLALTAEEEAKLEEGNFTPWGPPRLVVDSARTWREAATEGSIVRKPGAPQTSHFVDPAIVKTELVFENPDAYHIYRITEDRIRDSDPTIEGPEIQQKEDYEYRLGVPIEPPTVKAHSTADGIRVEVEKGGAELSGRFHPPDDYKVLRRKVSEPDRSPAGDPLDRFDPDPAAPGTRRFVIITDTTDFTGVPTSPLPGQTAYSEPGDTAEPEPEGWAVIGELLNTRPWWDDGYAAMLDTDVVNGAEYEYAGVARIANEESPMSRPVSCTFGGATHSSAIKVRTKKPTEDGVLEVDILAPEDESSPGDDYGETVIFEPPVDADEDTIEDLGEEIAERQFLKTWTPKTRVRLTVNLPLTPLDRGQLIGLPAIQHQVVGNSIILEQETDSGQWLLEGFTRRVSRQGDRLVGFNETELELVEP